MNRILEMLTLNIYAVWIQHPSDWEPNLHSVHFFRSTANVEVMDQRVKYPPSNNKCDGGCEQCNDVEIKVGILPVFI